MALLALPIVYIGGTLDSDRVECNVLSAAVHHGRDDPTTQPLASTITLELVGPLPAEAVMGARVEFAARVAGAGQYTRFVGEITDLGVGWDSVDVARPQVIATGDLGRLGRQMIGDVPWPAELDGARVSRILTAAGFPPTADQTDPGTLQLLARDVDRKPALDLAHEAASDGGGILWSSKHGQELYADALHRRGAVVAFEFQACDIGLGLNWLQSPEGLTNEAFVRYGVAPPDGEQAEVSASDPASISAYGTFGQSLTTQIASAADAQRRADELVARQAAPAWVLGGLEVNLAALDLNETKGVLGLEVHSLVSVTGLPEGSPATSAMLWVEGWRETVEALDDGSVSWVIGYATSDYCRTAAPPLWDDLPAADTWDTLDPALTWNAAVCMAPEPSKGRWNDVPASLRWSNIWPNSITWDTWPH
jgi:hypothetical protein